MNRYFFSSIFYLKMLRSSGILLLLLLCISSFKPAFGGDIVVWGESGVNDRAQQAGSDFIAVAAGAVHSLALRADGRIVIWDDSETVHSFESFDNNYTAIAAGGFHSLALHSDGSIFGYGLNWWGQANPPQGNDYVAIAGGVFHSLALRWDGSIVAWGLNNFGQAQPPSGAYHSLALRSNGSIIAWGDNEYGQIDLPEESGFAAIAGGDYFSMALIGPAETTFSVTIDIKPESNPNHINLRSKGVLPVAILSSNLFDATTVDPGTVMLNNAGVRANGKKPKFLAHMEDVNGDGLYDMIFYIDIPQLLLTPEDTKAVLQASTYDGTLILGEDSVSVVER
ncbi:MAG: hypothetical protein P8Y80_15035 [Acidobacteriota bacterium]